MEKLVALTTSENLEGTNPEFQVRGLIFSTFLSKFNLRSVFVKGIQSDDMLVYKYMVSSQSA